jgi:hypothetical protein
LEKFLFCYDPTVINGPKSPPIQTISTLFDLKDSCRFLRLPDLLQSLEAEVILPTKALARYGDHIRYFWGFGDKTLVWQGSHYFFITLFPSLGSRRARVEDCQLISIFNVSL